MALISPRRRARSRWAVLAVLIGAVLGAAFVSQAAATSPLDGFFVVNDQQGANDVPGQVDLTRMGRDDTDSSKYRIFMSWDSTDSWTGTGQTGDACALFDKDATGPGFVDYVVCGQLNNPNADPAKVAQTTGSPFVFSCNNKKTDRCGTPSPVPYTWGTQIISGPLGAVSTGNRYANLITATDPFAAGANYPNDSSLEIDISKSFLPAGAQLVNVCSYPSAGNGGNNNPFDCINTPGGGFLKIVKNTGAATTSTFSFAISPALASGATSASITGTTVPTGGGDAVNDTGALGIAITTVGSITETQPSTNWVLQSVSCKLANGTGASTGTPDLTTNNIASVEVQTGQTTVCTFTDRTQPSLTLAKTVVNDSGGTAVAKDFTLSATGSSNSFSGAAGTSTTSLTGNTGSHTVTAGVAYTLGETGATGYTGGTWSCDGGTAGTSGTAQTITLALGASVTCSITNNDNPASPSGNTTQSWVLYDSLTMSGLRTGATTPGSLTFKLWLTNTSGVCSSQVGSAVVVNNITANINYKMATGISVTTATTYYWTVDYSGDEFNNLFSTTCGSESTTISKTE